MARETTGEPKDVYTAAQAARILGIGERRVRQLVAEGTLVGVRGARGALRISQQSVNEERKRRRAAATDRGGALRPQRDATGIELEALAARVADAVGQRLAGQLELTSRAESLLRAELEEERARRITAEAERDELKRRLEELEKAVHSSRPADRKGGWWRVFGRASAGS